MPHFAILRVKKFSSVQNLIGSLKHNFREIPTPNANEELTYQNGHFSPSHQGLVKAGNNEINSTEQAIKLFHNRLAVIQNNGAIRKNAVLAVEYLLTASPEWWDASTPEQRQEWRKRNIDFLIKRHGVENIITATYQVDETTPHIAAFVIPEINGKLNARHFFGGRQKMSALQTEYANNMADLGLSRGIENSKATHQTIKQYYSKINSFYKHEFNKDNPELIKVIKTRIKIPEKKFLESQHEYSERVYDNIFEQVYLLFYGQYRKYKEIHSDLMDKHKKLKKIIDYKVQQLTTQLTEELKSTREINDMLQSMLSKSEDGFYQQKILISNLEDELSKKDRLIEQKDHQLAEQQKAFLAEQQKVFHEHQQAFENLCEQLKAAEQKLNDLKRENEPKKMDWSMDKNDPF